MTNSILSLAQFESGLPILAELDLSKLINGFFDLRAELPEVDLGGDPKAVINAIMKSPKALKLILPILETAGQAGKIRIMRKISAIVHATDQELLEAERNPAKLQELEDRAAVRTYLEGAQDLLSFFSRLGLSVNVSQSSSLGTENPERTGEPGPKEASPSGVS